MASGDPPNTSPAKGGKRKPLSQKEQSERFKETARELEVDQSGAEFGRALDRILPPKGTKNP